MGNSIGSFQRKENRFTAQPTENSIQMMSAHEDSFSDEETQRYHHVTIEQIAPSNSKSNLHVKDVNSLFTIQTTYC